MWWVGHARVGWFVCSPAQKKLLLLRTVTGLCFGGLLLSEKRVELVLIRRILYGLRFVVFKFKLKNERSVFKRNDVVGQYSGFPLFGLSMLPASWKRD